MSEFKTTTEAIKAVPAFTSMMLQAHGWTRRFVRGDDGGFTEVPYGTPGYDSAPFEETSQDANGRIMTRQEVVAQIRKYGPFIHY